MNARAEILAKLNAAGLAEPAGAGIYRPRLGSDLKTEFVSKARAADAVVHEIAGAQDLPESLQTVFASTDDAVPLHIAHDSLLRGLACPGSARRM